MTIKQAASIAGQAIGQAQDNFLERVSRINSTNIRVFTTLVLYMVTGIKYASSETWVPSVEWLGFLLGASGLDVAQYRIKRKTHQKFADDPPEPPGADAPPS